VATSNRSHKKKMPNPLPESRPHIAAEGELERGVRIEDCHVNGKRIGDAFSPEQWQQFNFRNTDEGLAEAAGRKAGRTDATAPAVETVRDAFSGACSQRRDDLQSGMEPWEATDPLKELADQHVGKGMSPKFLSENRIARDGLRGFRLVKDENGNPVKVRGLVLAEMPVEKVAQRNAFYRGKGNAAVAQIRDQYRREGGDTAVGKIE